MSKWQSFNTPQNSTPNIATTSLETETIKILIVDDSLFMRMLIKDILSTDLSIEVVGQAKNGLEAYKLTKELKPNVVIMDLIMEDFDGLYGIKHIMEDCPTPIVVLSSLDVRNKKEIIEALSLGAIDYVRKPSGSKIELRKQNIELITKIKIANQAGGELGLYTQMNDNHQYEYTFNSDLKYELVVIGASTGGPRAIESIIRTLPSNFKAPVLIVQHMPESFIHSFANRLNHLSLSEVIVADQGTILETNKIYIAVGHKNIKLKRDENGRLKVRYTSKVFSAYNQPSVDSVMLSAAEILGKKVLGVILSGMGRDGLEGLSAIRAQGGCTLAQSEKTCVVYGMPRVVVEANVVDYTVDITEMGSFILGCLD